MTIEQTLLECYPQYSEVETRISQLFADFAFWCRKCDVHVQSVMNEAADAAGIDFPEWFTPITFMIGDPFIVECRTADPPDPKRFPPNPVADERLKCFEAAITRHSPALVQKRKSKHMREAAVQIFVDTFCFVGDPGDLMEILLSGDRRFTSILGCCEIQPDEFYSRDELSKILNEGSTDPCHVAAFGRMLEGIGHGDNDGRLISGVDVLLWWKEHSDNSD